MFQFILCENLLHFYFLNAHPNSRSDDSFAHADHLQLMNGPFGKNRYIVLADKLFALSKRNSWTMPIGNLVIIVSL